MASVESPINVSDDEHSEPDSTSTPTSPSSSLGSLASAGVTLTSDILKKKFKLKEKHTLMLKFSPKKSNAVPGFTSMVSNFDQEATQLNGGVKSVTETKSIFS